MMIINKFWTSQITIPLFVVLLVVAVISGCASHKPGFAYKEWTRAMSQEGIFPVFPPREDVQVGDMWMLPSHPYETEAIEAIGGLGRTGIWSNSIGGQTVSEFYNTRPSFPSTADASVSIISAMKSATSEESIDSAKNEKGLKIVSVPRNSNTEDMFVQNDRCRLRQVAFPELVINKVDQFALNALVPIEYLNVASGFTSNRIRQISLKIPSAESCGIPAERLVGHLLKNKSFQWKADGLWLDAYDYSKPEGQRTGIRGLDKTTVSLARNQFDEAFVKVINNKSIGRDDRDKIEEGWKKSQKYIWIAVVNEVFYARAMDINISTKKAKGGGANIQPITNQMLKELDRISKIRTMMKVKKSSTSQPTPTPPTPPAPAPALPDTGGRSIVETIEVKESDDAFELARKINDYNKKLSEQSVPGLSVNFVSASDSSVGLRRIFDRPIAVGVRGVILRINVGRSTENALKVELYGL